MKIFIIRHAIAEERGPQWEGRDDERPLTADGIRKFRGAVRGLRELDIAPTHIFTSPLVRARQTAEILVGRLKLKHVELRISDALRPERPARPPEELRELGPEARVVLVGHNPHLARLASYLIAGHEELQIDLKKGGMVELSIQDPMAGGTALLEGLLTQRQLRKID